MAFSNGYTIGFAVAICVVCSLAVSTVSLGLRDQQKLNQERDRQKNILSALGLPDDGSELEGEAIDKLWAEKVKQRFIKPDGKKADEALDQDGDGDLDDKDLVIARKSAAVSLRARGAGGRQPAVERRGDSRRSADSTRQ